MAKATRPNLNQPLSGNEMPRFSGPATMMRLPTQPDAKGHAHDHEHLPAFDGLRPVLVGIVHGLAGSAAVAILVLAAIPETAWALAYLLVFGVGTLLGMTIITALLAAPAVYAGDRVLRFQRGIRLAAGTLSVVFGLVLAHEIVVNRGLFSATPSWSPR